MATKRNRIFVYWGLIVVMAVLILMAASCRRDPLPTLVETVTPTPEPIVESTPNQEVVSALTAVPQYNATPEPSSLPTATEEKCGPPEGWVVYQIRPGDTLFSLARATDTTVDMFKSANCLLSDAIKAGDTLFLPKLPLVAPAGGGAPQPAPATAEPSDEPPQEPTDEPDECASPFSCPNPDIVDTLTLDPGAGNDPDFVPCQNVTEPRIELDSDIKIIELGQRRFFYVCIENPLVATVTDESGTTRPVEGLLSTMPNPGLQMGDATAVIDWPVLPTEPTGLHTMTVTHTDGPPVNYIFRVDPPTKERILTVPVAAAPGEDFTVYYVNFPLTDTLPIDFWGGDEVEVVGEYSLKPHYGWNVPITGTRPELAGMGWGQAVLNSDETDEPGAYSISYDDKRIFTLLWLK